MAQNRNSLKIDIDLSKLYDGEPPMSTGAKSRRVRSATARSDRPRQQSVTGRGGRVAARTARDKRAVSARCPTKTESLIILFQARKRRLYSYWENGFEDPEHPIREPPLSLSDRQSKKVDISRSLANIKLAETSDSNEKHRRSRSGVTRPHSTVSASRGLTKDATQNDNGNSNLNNRKQAKDQPRENNRGVNKPFGRVYVGDISTSMRIKNSLSLKHATSARNYDISRDHALRESEHALHTDGGGIPGGDGSTRGRTSGFVPARNPRRSSASRNEDVSRPQGHKPSRESSSTRERVKVKVQSTSRRSVEGKRHSNTRPRSSYEKLLHYLTLVGDYPEEFEKLRRLTANVSHSPVHSLLRIGRAFTSGHRHFGRRETPVQLAAYELGCRQRHSACATVTLKSHPVEYSHIDSEIVDEDLDDAAARLPGLRQMLEEQGMIATELWLARRDAQKAVASVSTRQSLREREKALHALGEAEGSLQQWWVAQKDCRYLRV